MADATPIAGMIEALALEIDAIKRNSRSLVIELRAGTKQQTTGTKTLYSFQLAQEPNLPDDAPVKVVVFGKDVDGAVVSIRNGILTLALSEDLGDEIPFAQVVLNNSF